MMTDPIADMLTRIRNGVAARHDKVAMPASKIKQRIAEILLEEGYINGLERIAGGVQDNLQLKLKYHADSGESPIHGLQRVSRPGRRVYAGSDEIPAVLGGLGVSIVSTSRGVMTGKTAKASHVGGEVLCKVW
ncbi:MAG TPA: 30S ribosomal protein S8 [Acidobacteriota bacterium]|nr:30S ribosomal protein S8 [Acidobacteriota bacterium]